MSVFPLISTNEIDRSYALNTSEALVDIVIAKRDRFSDASIHLLFQVGGAYSRGRYFEGGRYFEEIRYVCFYSRQHYEVFKSRTITRDGRTNFNIFEGNLNQFLLTTLSTGL